MMSHPTDAAPAAFPTAGFFPDDVELNECIWRVWRNVPADAAQFALCKVITEVMSAPEITRDTPIVFSRFFTPLVSGFAGKLEMASRPWYSGRSRSPTLEERLRSHMFGPLTYPEIMRDVGVDGWLDVLQTGFVIRSVRKTYSSKDLLDRSDRSSLSVVGAFAREIEPVLSYVANVRARSRTRGATHKIPRLALKRFDVLLEKFHVR